MNITSWYRKFIVAFSLLVMFVKNLINFENEQSLKDKAVIF